MTSHALSRDELIRSISARSGVSNVIGAVTNDTLIDTSLIGANDYFTGKTLMLMSGLAAYETQTISAFDNVTGTITVDTAFSSRVLALTHYRVLNFGAGGGGGGGTGVGALDAVYFDPDNGDTLAAGNDGSPSLPLNSEAEVLTQLAALNFSKVVIVSDRGNGYPAFVAPDDITGVAFYGTGNSEEFDCNNHEFSGCEFHGLYIYGTHIGGGSSICHDCMVDGLYLNGGHWSFVKCIIFSVEATNELNLYDCKYVGDLYAPVIYAIGGAGYIYMFNVISDAEIYGEGLYLYFDNTCTGDIYVRGDVKIYDDSGGAATLYDHTNKPKAEVPIDTTATNAGETDIFDLSVVDTHYTIDKLRMKCADPGANTVTVRLYELINGAATEVDSFDITTANYTTYFSLMDMFGVERLIGDSLQVTVQASAGGPYAVTGSYAYRSA